MSEILIDRQAGVLTLTLNRPEKKNALTRAMYLNLSDALDAAAQDNTIRVVVITGSSRFFSAGNDLQDFLDFPPDDVGAPPWRFVRALNTFPKPIIAAVCGAAIGIGTTLLLHCDLIYAGENAFFRLPFVDLGICPEAASSLLLPRLLGLRRATELFLLAERIDAPAALAAGLVNRIVPAADALALAQAQAATLAKKPASVVALIKRLIKSTDAATVVSRIDDEAAHFTRMLHEGAAQEAISAFLENRAPDFRQY